METGVTHIYKHMHTHKHLNIHCVWSTQMDPGGTGIGNTRTRQQSNNCKAHLKQPRPWTHTYAHAHTHDPQSHADKIFLQMPLGLKPADSCACACSCDPWRPVSVLWHHILVTIFYMGDRFSHRHLLCPTDSKFVCASVCLRESAHCPSVCVWAQK